MRAPVQGGEEGRAKRGRRDAEGRSLEGQSGVDCGVALNGLRAGHSEDDIRAGLLWNSPKAADRREEAGSEAAEAYVASIFAWAVRVHSERPEPGSRGP